VDRYLVQLLETRTFAAADFFETRQGVCRITSNLARELAQTSTHWGRLVGVVAEDVAAMLESGRTTTPTPISGRNRSAGRGPHARPRPSSAPKPGRRCIVCGGPASADRETCGPACEASARSDSAANFAVAGTRALALYRAKGGKPVLGDEARGRIGDRSSDLTAAARDWQRAHKWPEDLQSFSREILPALADAPVSLMANATGLSVGYCHRVKKGRATPHPMWWEQLRLLGGSTQEAQG
jgi:hypothetical protein